VVSQIKATEAHSTQLGPVLLMDGSLFTTAAEPLDKRHAIVVVQEAPEIKKILDEESAWAHLHAFVYDAESHPMYIGGDPASIADALPDTLARSQAKAGAVALKRGQNWKWVATFHASPSLDWVFHLDRADLGGLLPGVFVPWQRALPLMAFVDTVEGRGVLEARARRGGVEAVRRSRDNFVRGKDVALAEPPYPFNELAPIVHALRWLMPQWKKPRPIRGIRPRTQTSFTADRIPARRDLVL